jgi:glutamate formiminotransferase
MRKLLSTIEALYEVCLDRIDMNYHAGVHPRVGAVDVCPFVPMQMEAEGTLKEANDLCREIASYVACKYSLPVFLYNLSSQPGSKQKELSYLRKGQYEHLKTRMANGELVADFGPTVPHPTAGVTIMGVRDFLVAFNVTLVSRDLRLAKECARAVRSNLVGVRAIGWDITEYGSTQISCNITNTRTVSIVDVFNFCKDFARHHNSDVKGCEIIGLIPEHNLKIPFNRQLDETDSISFRDYVYLLRDELNLSLHGEFVPEERIIEWHLATL